MTIAIWPTTLPKPERSTYQHQPDDPRIGRARDAGPPAWRRRYSAVAQPVKYSLMVSRALRQHFWDFYEIDCAHGSKQFYMPDPITEGWPLLSHDGSPVLISAGTPLLLAKRLLCLWGQDVPSETIVGIEFRINFTTVTMP